VLKPKDFKCKTAANDYLKISYKYREQMYKLSVTLQMISIYYGYEISALVPELNKIIQRNFDDINESLVRVDKDKLNCSMSVYFERNMNSIPEFQKAREIVIQAMLKDIDNSKSKLFKE
jgi:hypothetical protein